ncbi:MAG: DUF3308 domain-containing protein [Chlorobiaceae bacterium]|nr:DUF3308 domain-containing protein [Chlorobiaceae bacterium]MBA4310379.1 DUF3308 domain-containing protein [Chlorobiaceae bacterium]
MKLKNIITIITLMVFASTFVHAQTKLAQAGFKFLSMNPDPRGSALADAMTGFSNNSFAMFSNPSAMSELETMTDVFVGQTNWIADINYYSGGAALNFFDGQYGVVGVSFVFVDYGDLRATTRAQNEQGFMDIGTFSPNALSLGLTYAKALSEKFSVGGTVKYVRQSLGTTVTGFDASRTHQKSENINSTVAFDFGMLYKTGFESLNFGMSIRNFAKEMKYVQEGFQLPLTFRIGLQMNALDFVPNIDRDLHKFYVTTDAANFRDHPEQLALGGEYVFMNTLSLRVGYSFPNDERGFTAGVGIQRNLGTLGLGIDYGYIPFGIFDNVHKFSFRFSF